MTLHRLVFAVAMFLIVVCAGLFFYMLASESSSVQEWGGCIGGIVSAMLAAATIHWYYRADHEYNFAHLEVR